MDGDEDFDALCRQFRDAIGGDEATKSAILAKIDNCDDDEKILTSPTAVATTAERHLDQSSDVIPSSSNVDKPLVVIRKLSEEETRRAFFRAAATGDVAKLRSVILGTADNGLALVASVDDFDETALNLAATRNHPGIVSELLDNWPELIKEQMGRKNAHHYYPILIVAAMGSHDVAAVLLDRCDVNVTVRTRDGNSPLHLAAREGHNKTFKLLLTNAAAQAATLADLVGPNKNGETVLHLCAEKNLLDNAKRLLKLSKVGPLDINTLLQQRDNGNSTACHIAAMAGHEELAIALVKAGSDVDAQNDLGLTILHIAADRGLKMLAAGCIAKGAQLELPTEEFIGANHPLHLAATNGHDLIVRFLISKGAEPAPKNDDNKTPAALAEAAGHTDLAEKIEQGAFAPPK
jgi:ankyrin repeat protein